MRVLLCGSRWGQSYVPAIEPARCAAISPEAIRLFETYVELTRRLTGVAAKATGDPVSFELTGILAMGSQRSLELARELDVPLFRSVEQLLETDIACVAVGGEAGSALALSLLSQGISVLQEHPVRSDALSRLISTAGASGARIHVNYHFADCLPAASFIQAAKARGSFERPRLIQFLGHIRSLPSFYDIVGRVLGGPFEIEAGVARRGANLMAFRGAIAGVPLSAHCDCCLGRVDDGSDTPALHHITLPFRSGLLTLVDSLAGPSVWTESNALHARRTGSAAFDAGQPVSLRASLTYLGTDDPKWTLTEGQASILRSKDFMPVRFAANRIALERLALELWRGETFVEQQPDYLLALSRATDATKELLLPHMTSI